MPTKVEILETRRESLIQRAALQRAELSLHYQQLAKPLRLVDKAVSIVTMLRKRPWLVALGTTLIGAVGFRKWSIPGKVYSVWRGVTGAYNLWKKFQQPRGKE